MEPHETRPARCAARGFELEPTFSVESDGASHRLGGWGARMQGGGEGRGGGGGPGGGVWGGGGGWGGVEK